MRWYNLRYRGLAQLVEHRSPKPGVVGSSPASPAKTFGSFLNNWFFSTFLSELKRIILMLVFLKSF